MINTRNGNKPSQPKRNNHNQNLNLNHRQAQPKPIPPAPAQVDDPFADMAGSAFDDPALNMISNEPQKAKAKQSKAKPEGKPHQVQDSNDIILGMFAAGASPDPNDPNDTNNTKSILKPKQQRKDDNPFGADDSNPFGGNDDNPFDTLENPFGSDDLDPDNPFAIPSNNNGNKKQDDFMGDRDPFADM